MIVGGSTLMMIDLALIATVALGAAPMTRTHVVEGLQVSGRYKRLAVMPFQSTQTDGAALADSFITEFLGAGFSMVERSQMQAILEELKLSHVGLISNERVKQLGRLAEIDALIIGSVDAASPQEVRSVSLRLVDAETADVLLSSTFSNSDPGEPYLPLSRIPVVMVADIAPRLGTVGNRAPEEVARVLSAKPPPGAGLPRDQSRMDSHEIHRVLSGAKAGALLRVTLKTNDMIVGTLTSFHSGLIWMREWNGRKRFAYVGQIKRIDRGEKAEASR